jgi:hypothetical protein
VLDFLAESNFGDSRNNLFLHEEPVAVQQEHRLFVAESFYPEPLNSIIKALYVIIVVESEGKSVFSVPAWDDWKNIVGPIIFSKPCKKTRA